MKRFLLVEHQEGGCDYTIGCGTRVRVIEAESMQAAVESLKGKDKYGDYNLNVGDNERSIDEATLYEIGEVHAMDIAGLRHDRALQEAEERDAKMLAAKREQLKRLKQELGEG